MPGDASLPARPGVPPALPEEAWARLERALERFEDAWQRGSRPQLDDWLAAAQAERHALLRELVHEDLDYRLRAGEPARVEDYLRRYPELAADPDGALGLIADEFNLRRRREPDCSVEDYLRRFPQYREQLPARLQTAPGQGRAERGGAAEAAPPRPLTPDTPADLGGVKTGPPEGEVPRGGGDVARGPSPGRAPAAALAGAGPPGYELLEEIGRGGMGVVYKARQVKANRLVALKMLLSSRHASLEERVRFQIEAEAVARLQHPHIVQLHEVGEADGQPFLALELCSGGSLDQKFKAATPTAQEAAALVEALARAVHYAHGRGVLHRDLKPANVLLTADGTPKISDFGLAKRLDAEGDLSRPGQVVGTPSFMAPEQAEGRAREVGPATDVYALGALLYHALAGRPPFQGPWHEVLEQVRTQEPGPPSRFRPGLPRDLETVCLKCLHKEPGQRYATAADLADDLRRYRDGWPVRARPVGRLERGRKWAERNPAVAALLATVVLVLAAGAAASTLFALDARDQAQRARQNERQAWQNERQAKENEQRALRSEYASDMRLAQQRLLLGDVFVLPRLLDRHRPGAPEAEDRRGLDWRYLARFGQPGPQSFRSHPSVVYWLAYSPDGQFLATAGRETDRDGSVKVWDARSKQLLFRVPLSRPLWPVLNPNTVQPMRKSQPPDNLCLLGHKDSGRL
jgi:tRNA A-37 threonylcarbamoyl transferase component Bud32